jgi:hypothetical protein
MPNTDTPDIDAVLREFGGQHHREAKRVLSTSDKDQCAFCLAAWPCPPHQLAAEVARLREGLGQYGQHALDCPAHPLDLTAIRHGPDTPRPCYCGFDALNPTTDG